MTTGTRYALLIERLFFNKYQDGSEIVEFNREEITDTAIELEIDLPKNLGDVIYSFRYRQPLPQSIVNKATEGKEWIIESVGKAKYQFVLVTINRIVPNPMMATIKLPDSTPEIVVAYAQNDEQALLAKVRYNRLIDTFLGISAYSLQNHLRTTVKGMGQIEIDEIYVGVDSGGRQYVVPVQAKGGKDQLSVVQTKQDINCCREKFPRLVCRTVSAQFMPNDVIAMFELGLEEDRVVVFKELHYKLVPAQDISEDDLKSYSERG